MARRSCTSASPIDISKLDVESTNSVVKLANTDKLNAIIDARVEEKKAVDVENRALQRRVYLLEQENAQLRS